MLTLLSTLQGSWATGNRKFNIHSCKHSDGLFAHRANFGTRDIVYISGVPDRGLAG